MAHRQKNRDGTPIRHELTAANDCDTAHREVLRRMETYGKDPDATLEEVSRDTVLLLRALNHRVRHFQAQILADIKIRESHNRTPRSQPQSGNPQRARDHHYTHTSSRESPSEQTHRTDADEKDKPPPARQPVKNEETQPTTGQPAFNKTITNEHYSSDANRNHPCPAGQTHQEVRSTPEIDASVTNLVDEDDNGTETKIATTGQHRPQASKHMTSISDNENGDIAATPEHKIHKRDPNEPRTQSATANTSKKLRSFPDGKNTTTNDNTTPYHDYSPTEEQARPPTEGERQGTRPPRRPKDRDTTDPETKFDTRYAHYQRHTIIRPYATINQEEPHTNRDVNLVPDRGKRPNKAAVAKIEHEEPPPKLSESCTYKL
jgi:hypothetical protein